MIQNSFIDMESMFKLFEEDEEVRLQRRALTCFSCSLTCRPAGEGRRECWESALQAGESGVRRRLLQLHKRVGPSPPIRRRQR